MVSRSPTHNRSSMRWRRAFYWLVPVLLVAVWLGWQALRQPAQAELPMAEATRGDIEHVVTALGNLQPRDYVDVGAQVSGQLVRLHVEVGDAVSEGDLLAEIDADVQQARVEAGRAQLVALEAQLSERQAQLTLARQQFQRQERLLADDATSEDAFQIARATVLTTEAQIRALQAQIEQNRSSLRAEEATLGYTRIFAPMNGTVVAMDARQGQTLNANQMAPILMRIADLSTMTVWTEVSEADVSRLRAGMPAWFSPLGMPGTRWEGTLRQILPTPEIINNVVLYTALFDVDNHDGRLMTQMTAQVFFVLNEARDVVRVPVSAVQPQRDGKGLVTVINSNGQREQREVETGVSDRITLEIRSGLQEGETVLVNAAPGGRASANSGNRQRVPRGLF
ncbi:efflux RND transporter periplasmic adaptor subunit [Alcanivorax limicola]|uniref:efflux RND transporter periplasmic adaptor subunit n=1 Tax=Alcanivorax limicola TaxID=2874102 RepID=UPI001CBD5C38|nr:efflux RND transporter periplasmic adaptor subunit [Alcanivorax limicola]